jgi:hypothetical protein
MTTGIYGMFFADIRLPRQRCETRLAQEVIMTDKMLAIQHRLNPLHVYCRMVEKGMNKRLSISICKYYELFVYRTIAYLTTLTMQVCKLLDSTH